MNLSDRNKIGGNELKAPTHLLLQWKSLYNFIYIHIYRESLAHFLYSLAVSLKTKQKKQHLYEYPRVEYFSILVEWLYKHIFENQSKFISAYKIRDITSLTEFN